LTTDYSEALPEFVTPPQRTTWQTLQFLCDLHAFAHRTIGGELLWPASMPCTLAGSDAVPIANYGTSNAGLVKTVYRRGLGFRYGKSMQAIAGVHFNFSPPAAFWAAYLDHLHDARTEQDARSDAFMGLVRNYRRVAWLVTYLFGSSPAFSKSFRPDGHPLLRPLDASTWYAPFATSLRMSDLGYRNKTQARLHIAANSLTEYVDRLAAAVTTKEPRYEQIGVVVDGEYRQLNANVLQIENEYYSTIRPKPSKDTDLRPTVALRRCGVAYVEVRTLDLNLTDPCGINQSQLRFLEALLLCCLLDDSPPIAAAEQAEIDRRDVLVAREGRKLGLALERGGRPVPLVEWGHEVLDAVAAVAELLDADAEGYVAAVERERAALDEPERTPSARLLADLAAERLTFIEHALELARRHHAYFVDLPLSAAREQWFADVAARSLAEAAALERQQQPPFAEYLETHFAEA
jgi:glutamate--cysteine ligase